MNVMLFRLQAAVALLLAFVSAPVNATESGVSGTVVLSPARPGPQRDGEPSSRPLSGAELFLRDAHGRIVARANADSKGYFRVFAPAGEYELHVDTLGALYPRCKATRAEVTDGQFTNVDVVCDSGMR